ncbi:MAG: hypothetical protein HY682_05720 [Chloroflexi bacterium]|nr:hypothetical protein [Chloroflexota bacterium]
MRPGTSELLSDYLQRRATLDSLREFLWHVDWDSRMIHEDERAYLLQIEAICTGIDEGLDTEEDLRKFLMAHGPAKV